MSKQTVRQQMLERRLALGVAEWQRSSLLAQQHLIALEEFAAAGCVALYSPVRNEADTAGIAACALSSGKRLLYPVVCGEEMLFRQVDGVTSLKKGYSGILEPGPAGCDYQADEPDLIVTPGVAFAPDGCRIGYGAGFYDRFLRHSGCKACLVGLCHDFQLLEGGLPAEWHDIRMEIIVTDRRVIRCGSNRSYTGSPD